MASDRNVETQEALSQELKSLRGRCAEACNIIANNRQFELLSLNADNENDVAHRYMKGLQIGIQNSETPVPTDANLVTSQFLNEITEKTTQLDEMSAFTKGCIHDVDNEIKRLKLHIQTAQEAKARPWSDKKEVKIEHIAKAQEGFRALKTELYSLIQTLFPNTAESMLDVLTQLTTAKMNESATGYVEITAENHRVVELLRDMNIATTNPYNKMEVKLAN